MMTILAHTVYFNFKYAYNIKSKFISLILCLLCCFCFFLVQTKPFYLIFVLFYVKSIFIAFVVKEFL